MCCRRYERGASGLCGLQHTAIECLPISKKYAKDGRTACFTSPGLQIQHIHSAVDKVKWKAGLNGICILQGDTVVVKGPSNAKYSTFPR